MRSSALNALIAAFLIACTFGLTMLIDSGRRQADSSKPALAAQETGNAEKAPDVAMTTLDGGTIHLHEFHDRVILLNFWATWCPPCIAEFPQLLALARSLPDDVILLAVAEDKRQIHIDQFLQAHAPDYKTVKNLYVVHDKDQTIAQDVFGTVRYPETINIDPAFAMRDKISGVIPWDSPETKKWLLGFK